jgi:hypothetical protein
MILVPPVIGIPVAIVLVIGSAIMLYLGFNTPKTKKAERIKRSGLLAGGFVAALLAVLLTVLAIFRSRKLIGRKSMASDGMPPPGVLSS